MHLPSFSHNPKGFVLGFENPKLSDDVLEAFRRFICAAKQHSTTCYQELRTVLLDNDNFATRRLLLRSGFRCLHSKTPQTLADLLILISDTDIHGINRDIVTSLLEYDASECYTLLLSKDIEVFELWPKLALDSNPYVKTVGINTDTVFIDLLPDFLVWQVVSPCHRQGRRSTRHISRRVPNNTTLFLNAFDMNFESKNKRKSLMALETLRACNSNVGLHRCLARIFERPILIWDEWHLFLMKVLVLMGHRPSENLLSKLKESDDLRSFVVWYETHARRVPSLRDCARVRVRRSVSKSNLRYAVSSLCVPQMLKDYILYRDSEEFFN
ncbi:uncharacterized protein LOC124266827 isoform X2 [Haliotis rubra]|uniref:uncharacterized protein LOC124266827 isoform X2 n=1 Tax=Haliotis rubra TaxID=36100 RepID=UPI001EE5857C|nr:uncharacterized protein LOC124266827 isoform X2 [Haliotis rubra]